MEKITDIVIATSNKGKMKEYREMLTPLGIRAHSLKELSIVSDAIENGSTYEENSFIKAKYVAARTPFPVIADDSGIEIASLGIHFPGIYSARYAKANGGYPATFEKILKEIQGKDRSAEFHCCICFLSNIDAKPVYFEGICKGHLLEKPVGVGGFGYDPLFHCDEENLDFGTCSQEEKDHCSHRYKALQKFVEYIKG